MSNLSLFRFLFTSIISIVAFNDVYAQVTTVYTMGSDDVVVYECGTDAIFTDDNSGSLDAQDPYSCTNNTITFCPDVPGDAIQINFLGFDLQTNANPNNNDALFAYDGDNTGSNLVGGQRNSPPFI